MERKFFYFKQPVAYTEINAAFTGAENAVFNLVVDYGLDGIISGLAPVQHGGGNLTVDVTAGIGYDQLGERTYVPTLQNLNCAVDENAVSTAVSTSGHSKILSVFSEFERALSDPRTDGNADTVYFEQAESFKLNVVQGTEATSPTPPALVADQLLLADITLSYGQSAIVTANISYARAQYASSPTAPAASAVTAVGASGTRFSTSTGSAQSQLNALKSGIDALETNGVDTIKQFANIAALRATAAAPSYAVAAVCTVVGFGVFVWSASSTAADDGYFTIQPTGLGTGRWVGLTGPLGTGLAQNDATGRVPAAGVRNGIVAIVQVNNVGAGNELVGTSDELITGLQFTVSTTAQAGDILILLATVNLTTPGSGGAPGFATTYSQVSENGGGFATIPGSSIKSPNLTGAAGGSDCGLSGAAYHVVGASGGLAVQQHINASASFVATITTANQLLAVLIRP
jgi:hypothetical protein